MTVFAVWALRDGVARREGEHADEVAAVRSLATLSVPAIAICDGLILGSTGTAGARERAELRTAALSADPVRRGAHSPDGTECPVPGCRERSAPYQSRLPVEFRPLCRRCRTEAQTFIHCYRGRIAGPAAAVERVIERASRRHA